MIIARELGLEIGPRRLLETVSFTVGNSEKVALVGRNGAGKSTLLSVLLGHSPEHVRVTGSVSHQGTLGFLPQEPVPGGLGVEPIGLSHILSARGLDVTRWRPIPRLRTSNDLRRWKRSFVSGVDTRLSPK